MRRIAIVVLLWLGGAALGGTALAADEPPRVQRQHEVLQHRPSGFWTSNRPAVGGAYRWRLLGIGVALLGITGFGMWRLTRKASSERAARQ
jgi:hypothetical protein